MNKQTKESLQIAIPICLGYIPVALAFGLTSNVFFSPLQAMLSSLLVFGGASQFMALSMLSTHATIYSIILATFILNARHFLMTFKLNLDLKHEKMPIRLFLSSLMTDEGFASVSTHEIHYNKKNVYLIVLTSTYATWVIFTLVGALIGNVLPHRLSLASGISLYSLFIGLLVPAAKSHLRYLYVALVAALVHYLFSLTSLSAGISIIASILSGACFGVYLDHRRRHVK